MTLEETLQLLPEQIQTSFKQINILMEREAIQILANKPEHPRIIRRNAGHAPASLQHNRTKARLIPEGVPCDFLIRLGVMEPDGTVVPKHYSKFRQINRYLEIVDDIYDHLPDRQIKIIDFGCGKAYLTFALYHYMKRIKKRDVSITGLDLKQNVIQFCRQTAADLGWQDLQFDIGDIATADQIGRASCRERV